MSRNQKLAGWTVFVRANGSIYAPLERQTMNGKQLEISFEQSIALRGVTLRQQRMIRARWWFTQMRQVVDRAWDPAQPAKPEQVCLPWDAWVR